MRVRDGLTRQQRAAYDRPCYVAEDTIDRRFHAIVRRGGRTLSVGLTVNVGLE